MKSKSKNFAPAGIAAAAIALSIGLHALSRSLSERTHETGAKAPITGLTEEWEARTYDARVKLGAALAPNPLSTNLATLFLDNEAFEQVNDGRLAPYYAPATDIDHLTNFYPRPWPWPRFIHGQIVRELAAQGAKAVGFDIMFPELSANCTEDNIPTTDGQLLSSDQFFAGEMARAGNVYLAVEDEKTVPPPLFRTNAAGLVSIISKPDYSVLRRARPFTVTRIWHPLVLKNVKPLKLDLTKARLSRDKIAIPSYDKTLDSKPAEIPLNANGTMKLTKDGDINFADDPDEKGPATELPYKDQRAWNLGLMLAAKALGLDLDRAELRGRNLVLPGPNGLTRTIPLDSENYFYIDWSIRLEDLQSTNSPVYFGNLEELLLEDKFRTTRRETNDPVYKDRVVIIGSIATGNNITDVGGTPLASQTPLVTKHINIANSVINGRFVERTSLSTEVALIGLFGIVAAFLTWRLRMLFASLAVGVLTLGYIGFSLWIYVSHRYWIPLVMPVAGGFVLPHFALVSYRVGFERREQERVRGIFSKIVSPDVVQELLSAEKLAALSGARRNITVFFADVRGFTEFTDSSQRAAEEFVQKTKLTPDQTQKYYDQIAKEQLETVNTYLATIADMIKKHRGTLDKYMGDCVMAFWGAPTPNDQHALDCVRAAVEAQRALNALNEQRAKENERRNQENAGRIARGEAPLAPLALLSLGTGINTGSATVGLMGSDATILNYTVFGREVNLASRLEGASGRGRILISEATLVELQRTDPTLAATCVSQPPVTPKGFRQPIPVYEVPWKQPQTKAATPA